MRNKIAYLILAAVFSVLLLSACSGSNAGSYSAPSGPAVQPTSASAPEAVPDGDVGKIIISEFMVKNDAVIMNARGIFSDWVELQNVSDEDISLDSWALSDGKTAGKIENLTLAPGAYALLFTEDYGFSLSRDEELLVFNDRSTLIDSALCTVSEANISAVRSADSFEECRYPTPGFENSAEGFEQYWDSRIGSGGLLIYSAAPSSRSTDTPTGEECDIVVLKNYSGDSVSLAAYCLSDKNTELSRFPLPDVTLAPGEEYTVYCDLLIDNAGKALSLDAQNDSLFLSCGGAVCDFAAVHDVPLDGSFSRSSGGSGFYYLDSSSASPCRYVSRMPVSLTADGVYDGSKPVTLELSADGVIYYTDDGSIPTTQSKLYTSPIELYETAVIRAVSVEPDSAVSRVLTLSFIIGEGDTLPVLSIVTDIPSDFNSIYNHSRKGVELTGCVSLFEDGGGFTADCGVALRGHTGLNGAKKSLGLVFRGRYGCDELDYDVFGNGVSSYTSLSVRAGHDWNYAIVRNEFFQNLCLEMSDSLITQHGKYCCLYINGRYRGIYCLKEELNRTTFARMYGVDRDSVQTARGQVESDNAFYQDVYAFIVSHNMADPGSYNELCSVFDIDGLIDWIILEGFSANQDTQGNVRFFKSDEADGVWHIAFYDLDWSLWYFNCCFGNLFGGQGNAGLQMPVMLWSLLENRDFREALITTYSQVCRTVLSNENCLKVFDSLCAEVEGEAVRNSDCWGYPQFYWQQRVDELRRFFTDYDWEGYAIDRFCKYINLSYEEKAYYFG